MFPEAGGITVATVRRRRLSVEVDVAVMSSVPAVEATPLATEVDAAIMSSVLAEPLPGRQSRCRCHV